MEQKLIEAAARQVLSETLGFEGGLIYYLLLTGQEREIEKEFSYSKKYRLMKLLFDKGALGKIKPENKDLFNYFILPPSFVPEGEVRDYLKELYIKNESLIYKQSFFQVIMKMNVEEFVEFLKQSGIDPKRDRLNISFSKIRTKDGYEFIGSIEVKRGVGN